jgi:hypothetical protein
LESHHLSDQTSRESIKPYICGTSRKIGTATRSLADHIPQDIRDTFLALHTNTSTGVQDEREGYVTSLQDGLFEDDLDTEVRDLEAGTIVSRSFFSDFHGQEKSPNCLSLGTDLPFYAATSLSIK